MSGMHPQGPSATAATSTVHSRDAPLGPSAGSTRLDESFPGSRPSLPDAQVPTTAAEWEAKKSIIYGLYMVDNIRVQDVARIMTALHGFRATPRMYKQRFIKWQWQKYNRSRRGARKGASYPGLILHGDEEQAITPLAQHTSNDLAALKTHRPLPYVNSDAYDIQKALSSWEKYLYGWAVDGRWKTNNKFECLGGSEASLGWINQDFRGAIEHFRRGDAAGGGRLLRYGFMRLEDVLVADHVECLWVSCVQIPQMLLDAGHLDILVVFLRHVQNVASARLPRNHPLAPAAHAMRSLAERAPGQMRHYVEGSGNVWINMFKALRGGDDAVTLSLRRSFLYIVPPTLEAVDSYLNDLLAFAAAAAQVYGQDNLLPVAKEIEALYTRWLYKRNINKEMLRRVQALLARLDALAKIEEVQQKAQNPSTGNASCRPNKRTRSTGASFERCYALMALIPLCMGDYAAAEQGRRTFLAASHLDKNMWLALCMELENAFRDKGYEKEADEIQLARLEQQVPQKVLEVLDKEESELAGAATGRQQTPTVQLQT